MVRASIVLAILLLPALARADDRTDARAAYEEGAAAYDASKWRAAAAAFARADALAPKDSVLGLALTSCARDGEPVLCMNLVERAAARDTLKKEREAVAKKLQPSASGIAFDCADPCTVKVDGTVMDRKVTTWLAPGAHQLDFDTAHGPETRSTTLNAGEILRVSPSPVAAPAPVAPAPVFVSAPLVAKPEHRSKGISPLWFWIGTGVTAVLGGCIIGSGIDTVHQNDAFKARPEPSTRESGIDAQTRTNVFIGATAGAALVTAVLGTFFVKWSSSE